MELTTTLGEVVEPEPMTEDEWIDRIFDAADTAYRAGRHDGCMSRDHYMRAAIRKHCTPKWGE